MLWARSIGDLFFVIMLSNIRSKTNLLPLPPTNFAVSWMFHRSLAMPKVRREARRNYFE